MTKFAKLFEIEGTGQVLVTKGYDSHTDTAELHIRMSMLNMTSQFVSEEARDDAFDYLTADNVLEALKSGGKS